MDLTFNDMSAGVYGGADAIPYDYSQDPVGDQWYHDPSLDWYYDVPAPVEPVDTSSWAYPNPDEEYDPVMPPSYDPNQTYGLYMGSQPPYVDPMYGTTGGVNLTQGAIGGANAGVFQPAGTATLAAGIQGMSPTSLYGSGDRYSQPNVAVNAAANLAGAAAGFDGEGLAGPLVNAAVDAAGHAGQGFGRGIAKPGDAGAGAKAGVNAGAAAAKKGFGRGIPNPNRGGGAQQGPPQMRQGGQARPPQMRQIPGMGGGGRAAGMPNLARPMPPGVGGVSGTAGGGGMATPKQNTAPLKQLLSEWKSSYQEAKKANEDRYAEILKGFRQNTVDVLGQNDTQSASAKEDAQRAYDRFAADAIQSGIGRGLNNSTVRDSLERGVESDRQRAIRGIENDRITRMTQLMNQLKNQELNFMERREDTYPSMEMMAQLAQKIGEADPYGNYDYADILGTTKG